MEIGILAYGAYIPRRRLTRKSVADANAWFNPALKGQAKAERSMAASALGSPAGVIGARQSCRSP